MNLKRQPDFVPFMLNRTFFSFLATLLVGFYVASPVLATHIRGGYITAKRISGYKYEFLLTIYRDTNGDVLNETNNLYPDRSISDVLTAPVIQPIPSIPGKQTQICMYRFEYTYRSPGIYTAYHYQLNRNQNVLNMDNSINTTFYVETKVVIDPFLALDQSPIVTKAAVDIAALGAVYRYNPGAYDPDGDSLSYQLVPSRQFLQGQEVSAIVTNYRDPALRAGGLDSSGTRAAFLSLNEQTGDLVWNCPRMVGEFNTAIKIIQWRKLRPNRARRDSIGFVLLDIQIIVRDTRNRRPLLRLPKDTCVVAGTFLTKRIFAEDPDLNDRVSFKLSGELDTILPREKRARFYTYPQVSRPYFADFEWMTRCSHVRRLPYYAVFTAEDIPVITPSLVDVRVWRIKVVGPPPNLKTVQPAGNGRLRINWESYTCQNAARMDIYRKIDSSAIVLDTCNPGMPSGSGFVKIGEVPIGDTTFLDDNGGRGLKKGPSYCYRLVAVFPDPAGGESLVSNEICRALPLDIPLLTNVDVTETSTNTGKIFVRWTRPFFIDTNVFKPPYKIHLWRYQGNEPPLLVKSTNDTTDTTFVDNGLDTRNKVYRYQLFFRYGELVNLIDSTEKASSVRLELQPGIKEVALSWSATTPWSNNGLFHLIYKKIDNNFVLVDSIRSMNGNFRWVDRGQFEGEALSDTAEYCYYVQTRGTYSNPQIYSPLENRSQINCAVPTDTIKPCPPFSLIIKDPLNFNCDDCENLKNQTEFARTLTWRSVQQDTCGRDVIRYRIYYARYEDDPLSLIASTLDTQFVHSSLTTLSGCYAVTALDRSGNESTIANRQCVDNCIVFDLPNTITPDNNLKNDLFTPRCVSKAFIEKVHFTVYNRWGKRVFDSEVQPEINWDGISEDNSTNLVSGIYYYLAEVKAKRLRRSDENMKFNGWIFVVK